MGRTTDVDAPSDHNLSVPLDLRPLVLGHEEVPTHVYFTFETGASASDITLRIFSLFPT